jgi:hypothetical protein
MENRHRILLGRGVEVFPGVTSEKQGCLALLDRARQRLRFRPATLGADKGLFHQDFIEAVLTRGIEPHIAVERRGSAPAHARVRMRRRGAGYQLSSLITPACSNSTCGPRFVLRARHTVSACR